MKAEPETLMCWGALTSHPAAFADSEQDEQVLKQMHTGIIIQLNINDWLGQDMAE